MPNHHEVRTAYTETCASYHRIDDFRAKLLALLPTVSGAEIFFLLHDLADSQKTIQPEYVTAAAIFGLLVSLGLYFYELRGVQRCIRLTMVAKELESAQPGMSVNGQFTQWPHSVGRFIAFCGPIYKRADCRSDNLLRRAVSMGVYSCCTVLVDVRGCFGLSGVFVWILGRMDLLSSCTGAASAAVTSWESGRRARRITSR
jgi:hypothetical protein